MCSNIQSLVVSETWSLENCGIEESNFFFFSDDTWCVNLILAWNELVKSIKLLISFSGKVHTEKMSSINLFQRVGFCGLPASSCLIDVSHAYDCESYCHLGTQSDAVCL